MKLIEKNGFFNIDYGAPLPIIISSDNDLYISFYVDDSSETEFKEKRLVMKFNLCLKYTFGMPGNETIYGHSYSKLGLESGAFYELKNSDLIEQLKEIDKIHSYYNHDKWKMYKHYILTFHDNMFECVAIDFEILKEDESQLKEILNNIL